MGNKASSTNQRKTRDWLVYISQRASELRDMADRLIVDINQMLEQDDLESDASISSRDMERLRVTRPAELQDIAEMRAQNSRESRGVEQNRPAVVESRAAVSNNDESSLHRVQRLQQDNLEFDLAKELNSEPPSAPAPPRIGLSRPKSSPLIPHDFALTARCEDDDLANLLERSSGDEEELLAKETRELARGADRRETGEFLPISPHECVMMINELRDGRSIDDHDALELDEAYRNPADESRSIHLGAAPQPAQEVIRQKLAMDRTATKQPVRRRPPASGQTKAGLGPGESVPLIMDDPPRREELPSLIKGSNEKISNDPGSAPDPDSKWDMDSGRWDTEATREADARGILAAAERNPEYSGEDLEELLGAYLEDE